MLRVFPALLLFIVAALVVACGSAATPPAQPTAQPADTPTAVAQAAPTSAPTPRATPTPVPSLFPLTVTDDAGRTVVIEREPQRIISLAASNTEMIYAAGLQDKLVGVDDHSDYPPETASIEKVGGFSKPNIEKIVSLTPDLILAANLHVKAVVPELENRGLVVLVFHAKTLDQVPDSLETIGRIGGNPRAAQEVADDIRVRVKAVIDQTAGIAQRPRVFYEISPDLFTPGPGTFLDDMIGKAGGENIAHDAQSPWPKLSPDAVILKDPRIIIVSHHGSSASGATLETVTSRPGWNVISAVKDGKIVLLENRDIFDRPGPRAVEGLEFLARTFHPDLFPAR